MSDAADDDDPSRRASGRHRPRRSLPYWQNNYHAETFAVGLISKGNFVQSSFHIVTDRHIGSFIALN
jgi:hypothetical protein